CLTDGSLSATARCQVPDDLSHETLSRSGLPVCTGGGPGAMALPSNRWWRLTADTSTAMSLSPTSNKMRALVSSAVATKSSAKLCHSVVSSILLYKPSPVHGTCALANPTK